jgi:signal transduction histidine kinase
MIALSPVAAAVIALVCGGWLAFALWWTLRASRRAVQARAQVAAHRRSGALLAASPAVPLIVHRDGRLEGGQRLGAWFGFGIDRAVAADLLQSIGEEGRSDLETGIMRAAKSGASFSVLVRPEGSERSFLVQGGPAPASWPAGTSLLWFLDHSAPEDDKAGLAQDVERLTAALEALSGLIEAAPFPMWYRGPDLKLALVNSAYVRAVEAETASGVVEKNIELIDESEGDPAALASAVRESGETRARNLPATIAGERRMMRVVEVPLGPSGVAGYAIDVEDSEQARTDLSRFVRAQRDMLDRLSAGVAQFGRDRGLIFFNQAFTRLFALNAAMLAERPEFNRLLDSMRESSHLPEVRDYPDWKREHDRWFTGGLAAEEEDWHLPGGRHLRVVAQPLPDGGLLLIFEDRTEQLRLASARDTLLRVRAATFDNLFEAVGVFASDGRLALWNNRFRELWRFEEEVLAAHPRIDALLQHIRKQLRNANHAGLVRELVRSATVERKQRSGRVSLTDGREFEFAAVPLPDGNALFAMLDVTASRTVEAALRERAEALEAADRLKTAFVSNMSYELRTPLTSIAGFAEMLAAGYAGELPQSASDYVAAILESVARLGALIDDVLDLTQSDTGSLLLAEDEVDLAALCEEAGQAFGEQAERKGIDFEIIVEPAAGTLTGDRRRLRQSIDNLLKNAIASTEEGGRVLLHASGNSRRAEINVSDNGKGISAAEQARVFDRFHRSEGGGDSALGLGLPLAKQFVEAHGGTIELLSRPGQGTTVTVRLPRKH